MDSQRFFRMQSGLAAALTLLIVGCASPGNTALTVKIGHVAPLSGPIAHLGQDNERGARLAIEELNARPIQIGGQSVRFELVALDDAADPRRALDAAQQLVASGVKAVVGHLNSGTSIPAARIYADAGVPAISPSATNPRLTRMGFNTSFRLVRDDLSLGQALGSYSVQELKAASITVVDDRSAYGQGVAEAFIEGARGAAAIEVDREFTRNGERNFSGSLSVFMPADPSSCSTGAWMRKPALCWPSFTGRVGGAISSVGMASAQPRWGAGSP